MASFHRLWLRGSRPPRRVWSSSLHGLPAFEPAPACVSFVAFLLLLLRFSPGMVAGYSYPGKIGVTIELKYGVGIISPRKIVDLLQFHAISRAKLYDANVTMLRAFACSGIDLIVSVPNEDVPSVARSATAARRWVADHIAPFRTTKISAIMVGYRWLSDRRLDRTLLLPAILNVNAALGFLNLTGRGIRVSTSSYMDLLSQPAWMLPPSRATFKPALRPILRTLLNFLMLTDSYFDFDVSPYEAYVNDPSVSLSFVLFESTTPIRDNNTGIEYYNMFDLQVDAVNSALEALLPTTTEAAEALGHLSKQLGLKGATGGSYQKKIHPNSGGHPSKYVGPINSHNVPTGVRPYGDEELGLDQIPARERAAATIRNAQTYNQNLINRVLTKKGTPRYPSQPITTYMFELFNEALRFGPESQKHFGFFYPSGTSVYPLDFCSPYL